MPLDEQALQQIRALIDERVAPIEIKRIEFEEIKLAMRQLQVEVAHLVDSMKRGFAEVDRRFAEQGERIAEQGERIAEQGERIADVDRRIAEANERMDLGFAEMNRGLGALRQEIGGLTNAYGLDLEDVGAYVIPHYLRYEEGIEVAGLTNHVLRIGAEEFEIDLFGEGRTNGERRTIVAEVKSRVHIREIEEMIARNEKIAGALGGEPLFVLFPRRVHPDALARAHAAGMLIVPWDYQYRRF